MQRLYTLLVLAIVFSSSIIVTTGRTLQQGGLLELQKCFQRSKHCKGETFVPWRERCIQRCFELTQFGFDRDCYELAISLPKRDERIEYFKQNCVPTKFHPGKPCRLLLRPRWLTFWQRNGQLDRLPYTAMLTTWVSSRW